MKEREIEIIDAVGKYVDQHFQGKGRLNGSYTEEAQDYFNELLDRVIDINNGVVEQLVGVEPYTLISIDDVAKEMYQDAMKIRTLKKALGLL